MALHTRVLRLVLSGLMGALLVVSKQAMSGLPNLEPVSLLIILFALELPRETPGAITVFILLQGVLYGFGLWWVMYLYVWYLLALLMGWIALDVILNIFPERYIPWAVGGCALLGWGASLVWELPFCLIQGAVITPYLYLGYLAKRQHWLDQPLSRRMSCILWAAVLLIPAAALATRRTDCVSMAEWSLGPISILLDGLAGLLFVRLFLRWSQRRNPLVRFFEAIGRRSLYIFCVHTVELIAIPWYLFAAKYADRPVLGISLQYILSLGSIWLICALLQRRRDLIIKLFPARRRTPQVHYAPRH